VRFARERLLKDSEMVAYCLALYDGTTEKQPEIDPKLTATATNWRLSRMHPADRNVLRLAAYELLYDPAGQPLEVIIHEANELAARFGSAESARFVNGVLDKIAKSRGEGRGERGEEEKTDAAAGPPTAPTE
jgi:N utilization substance protein B